MFIASNLQNSKLHFKVSRMLICKIRNCTSVQIACNLQNQNRILSNVYVIKTNSYRLTDKVSSKVDFETSLHTIGHTSEQKTCLQSFFLMVGKCQLDYYMHSLKMDHTGLNAEYLEAY